MKLRITRVKAEERKKRPADESQLGFGNIFTDHMFLMDYEEGRGWYDPRIEPFRDLALHPATMALHYGQEIFEGLKAYAGVDGGICLFRPVERLCMPPLA